MGEYVVGDYEVGAPVAPGDGLASVGAEILDQRWDAQGPGYGRNVGRRFYTERGNIAGDEVAQQVSVVTRDLDHEAVRCQPEPLRDRLRVPLGVRNPGVGVRGEVRIVRREDRLTCDVRRELHEKTRRAQAHVQWVKDLRFVKALLLAGSSHRAATSRGRRMYE